MKAKWFGIDFSDANMFFPEAIPAKVPLAIPGIAPIKIGEGRPISKTAVTRTIVFPDGTTIEITIDVREVHRKMERALRTVRPSNDEQATESAVILPQKISTLTPGGEIIIKLSNIKNRRAELRGAYAEMVISPYLLTRDD